MSYVETVQLVTGLTLLVGALVGYLGFSFYYRMLGRNDLIPFLKYALIAGSCIGSHQVFEFLSLYTGSQIVYKTGLLISLSGMIFFLISLEKLYNRNVYAKFLSSLVGFIAIYLFLKPVEFTTLDFHLEHHSIVFWTVTWFALLMYWNICILFEQKNVKQYIPKSIIWMYILTSMMASFIVAAGYSLGSYYISNTNICTTYPSVWCTFGVIQVILLPFLFYFLPKKVSKLPPKTQLPKKIAGIYFFIAIIITTLVLVYLSTTGCFNMVLILS